MTTEELERLASKEFNQILASDPVLKDLRNTSLRNKDALRLFLDVAGLGGYRIGKLPCRPLTAAKWVFLSLLGNAFAVPDKLPGITEANIFLFVLANDLRTDFPELEMLPALSADYSAATGLETEKLECEILETIREAFQPLSQLSFSTRGEAAEFDAFWLTQIAGVVARESGLDCFRVMHDLPLSAVFTWYAAWCARESTTVRIVRTPDAETESQIEKRIAELQQEFLSKEGKVKNADGDNDLA